MEPSQQPTRQIVRLTGITQKGITAVQMYGSQWYVSTDPPRSVPLDPAKPDERSTIQCLFAVSDGYELWVRWPEDPNVTIEHVTP
jgi:hypothetical protein